MQTLNLESVLFVCSGNIFRSPFAEYYFRYKYAKKLHKVFSRGTSIFYGQPHPTVSEIASEYNVDMTKHRPRVVEMNDVLLATSIFVMDVSHYEYITRLVPESKNKVYYLGLFSRLKNSIITDVSYDDVNDNPELIRDKFNIIAEAINDLIQENICNEN